MGQLQASEALPISDPIKNHETAAKAALLPRQPNARPKRDKYSRKIPLFQPDRGIFSIGLPIAFGHQEAGAQQKKRPKAR